MYPRTYLETFNRYQASNEVFVAMPFTNEFQLAFSTVIQPAIEGAVLPNGDHLVAKIINRGTFGAPDIHERIFDAILHSRLRMLLDFHVISIDRFKEMSEQIASVPDDGMPPLNLLQFPSQLSVPLVEPSTPPDSHQEDSRS